jgi:hypothetical protein
VRATLRSFCRGSVASGDFWWLMFGGVFGRRSSSGCSFVLGVFLFCCCFNLSLDQCWIYTLMVLFLCSPVDGDL